MVSNPTATISEYSSSGIVLTVMAATENRASSRAMTFMTLNATPQLRDQLEIESIAEAGGQEYRVEFTR